MTIREFIGVLRARWRWVLVCTLVVLGVTAFAVMQEPRVYEAHARVYFSTEKPVASSGNTQGDRNQTATYVITRQDLTTYVEVLSSPSIMGPLRESLGLQPGAPVDVSATVSDVTNVLDFTARSSDPQLAADIANKAGPVLASAARKFSPLLANAGQTVSSEAISPATVPSAPVSPQTKKDLLIGLLAGLVIGIGLALIRHVADTKVRGVDDVKLLSDRPILGKLPLIRNAESAILSFEHDPHGRHAEAIRRLRTNILFVDVTTQAHSFVITSSNPGEGKTTTSINLAMAMADTGSKVLLIDGDLRNPSVAQTMGFENEVGLTTILLGRATPVDAIRQWNATSLHVLAAGQIPPNPSELLGSEAMADLFDKLSQDFDFILIDSPPINPVIDAVLLNRLTRGLIMVVASDRTRRKDLESALSSLATVEVPVAGFAVNYLNGSGSRSYNYGYYGYGQTAQAHATTSSRSDAKRGGRRSQRAR